MILSAFRKIYTFLIDTLQSLLIAAAVFLVVYQFLLRPFNVVGLSMYPNFANMSYVLTNLIGLRFQDPKLGDVIVFKPPHDPEKVYIKRVIGTPGDTIRIENGEVYLNNEILDESSYLGRSTQTNGGLFLGEGKTITIPKTKFFVMGDNRKNSSDSRAWGFLDKSKIEGISLIVYWPPERIGIVKNPYKN